MEEKEIIKGIKEKIKEIKDLRKFNSRDFKFKSWHVSTLGLLKSLQPAHSREINAFKKHAAVMGKPANLISPEGPAVRFSLREMINMKSSDERHLRTARVKLNKLESALKKINNPEFGTCFICEQPIPLARLSANPGTTRCIKCEDD